MGSHKTCSIWLPNAFQNILATWNYSVFAATSDGAEAAAPISRVMACSNSVGIRHAMLTGHRFPYHAVVSVYLNLGLLDLWPCAGLSRRMARRSCAAQQRGRLHPSDHRLREFVRGIYWWQGLIMGGATN
jgi:deoxyribodipyrimidine photolyase-like uncharacterized protein